jgi:7-carboxy-7-deazaguanine synthase
MEVIMQPTVAATDPTSGIIGDPVETFNYIPEDAKYMGEGEDPRTRQKSKNLEKKVPVVEIFGPTIQGEGAMIGVRTSFIRFGLCDYKCLKCDSMHAVDPVSVKKLAKWMTASEIVEELQPLHVELSEDGKPISAKCDWVTFSGGNPCIHDLTKLVMELKDKGINIAVETQGTFLPQWLHMCDVITVSPKSPGMGEQFEQDKFFKFLEHFCNHPGFNVKVVIFSMADIEWCRTINDIMRSWGLGDKVYLSLGNPYPPGQTKIEGDDVELSDEDIKMSLLDSYRVLVEDLLQLDDMANVKFLPQLHVLTWANKQKV